MKDALFPVVILAGGLAKRLRPVTETLPKSLIPVNGVPFIDHQLYLLNQQGVSQVVLCVGYLGEMIETHVGDGCKFHMDVHYAYDGDVPLGTAGAIKQALHLLSDTFFVLYGDSYLPCHYAEIQATFKQDNKLGLMTVFCNRDQWDTSNVEYQDGKIIAYDKGKRCAKMGHIDYGLSIFSKKAFLHVPNNIPYDLALLYQLLLADQQLAAYEVKERFYEVGSFAGIKELEYHLSLK